MNSYPKISKNILLGISLFVVTQQVRPMTNWQKTVPNFFSNLYQQGISYANGMKNSIITLMPLLSKYSLTKVGLATIATASTFAGCAILGYCLITNNQNTEKIIISLDKTDQNVRKIIVITQNPQNGHRLFFNIPLKDIDNIIQLLQIRYPNAQVINYERVLTAQESSKFVQEAFKPLLK